MNVDAHTEATFHANADMIFVKNFTRPEFLGPRFYPKKRDNGKFTTKQRKFFKLLNIRQNAVMLQNNILSKIQLTLYFKIISTVFS